MTKIILAVGSTSRIKREAVLRAADALNLTTLDFHSTHFENVPSQQDAQPVGMRAILAGAFERAQAAQRLHQGSIGIGIENGIERVQWAGFGPRTVEYAAVVAILPSGQVLLSTSQGILLPEQYVRIAEQRGFQTVTVGAVIAEQLGGNAADPHSLLTNGLLSRIDSLVPPTTLVLGQAWAAFQSQ